MTEEQILDEWFNYPFNTSKLPTVQYSEEVALHIHSTSDMRIVGDNVFYKVGNIWQKIKTKNITT